MHFSVWADDVAAYQETGNPVWEQRDVKVNPPELLQSFPQL